MKTLITAAVLAVACAAPAAARVVQVKMLNKGAGGMMVYEPAFVTIAPGDTVRFVPVDKGHNAESLTTMLPPGAAPFKGKINEEVVAKFAAPGLYGVRCLPHLSMGMVALVQVGTASKNKAQVLAEANKLPPLAKKNMLAMLARAK